MLMHFTSEPRLIWVLRLTRVFWETWLSLHFSLLSHCFTVPSSDPDQMRPGLSPATASLFTLPVWPATALRTVEEVMSKRQILQSPAPEASKPLSSPGSQTTEKMLPSWGVSSLWRALPFIPSHTITVLSSEPLQTAQVWMWKKVLKQGGWLPMKYPPCKMATSWTPLNAINTTSVTLMHNIVVRKARHVEIPPTPCRVPAWPPCWWSSRILPQRSLHPPLSDVCEARRADLTFSSSLFCSSFLAIASFWKQQCHILAFAWTPQAPGYLPSPLVHTPTSLCCFPRHAIMQQHSKYFHGFSDWG